VIIEFDSVRIKDFGVFVDESLDLHALGLGLHFVKGDNQVDPLGSNGSGKTTIWNAVVWCLTGKTIDGLKGPDVIPWERPKAKPEVTVTVYKGSKESDLKRFIVKRSTVTNGLWINGKVVAQERVDELIGLTWEIICHTITLGQGQDLFFDLKPTAKMALLSEALQLDRWGDRSKRASKTVSKLESAIAGLAVKLADAERSTQDARDTIADLKARSEDWERDRNKATDKRDRAIKVLQTQLEVAEVKWGEYDLAYDGAETELRAAERTLDKENPKLVAMKGELARASAELIVKAEALDELEAKKKKGMKAGGTCESCGQPITVQGNRKHVAELTKKIDALDADIATRKQQLKALTAVRNKQEALCEGLAKQVSMFREKANNVVDDRARAEKSVIELKAGITQLRTMTSEEQENPYTEVLQRARDQLKNYKALIAETEDLINASERKKARVAYWVEGFKNVRLYLIQEVLEELEAVTQTLLGQIGLGSWEVHYAMERETKTGNLSTGLTVTIHKAGHDKGVRWESWSGGEGQRLRLIGAMALSEVLLRRAGVECDMMVIDEPTQHVSPEGVRDIADFLIERGRNTQIFYVDHQVVESNLFASTIMVTKTPQGAHIEVRK
jgi:DNA repair exonuclease SbcCD ATPase subunit